jgi:hypothetical protein
VEDVKVTERLTMKVLSGEMETLRKQIKRLEAGLERKLESAMEKATEKLKARIEASDTGIGGLHVHGGAGVDVNARRQWIAETAYLRAERRGFVGGNPEQDWLEAEREIDHLLLQGWTKNAPSQMTGQESQPREESRL